MNYKPPPKSLPCGSRVICYLRDSGGASQELSTSQQLRAIEAYCQEYGLILKEAFIDAAKSGTSTDKREEFERMIDASRREKKFADGLLVWNFARFARNLEDATYYKADLRRRGIVVHSLTDEIPEGNYARVVETIIDIANEEKSKQTGRDSQRGLQQRALEGYIPGGSTPPRGYRAVREIISSRRDGSPRIGTRWEADPELAPLVTLAFKMRAQGYSLNEIMRSPCGVLYKNKSAWGTFFKNKSYLGYIKCGEVQVYNPDAVPPLVDVETWEAVQRVREMIGARAPNNLLHPKRCAYPSALSGLAVCIYCGTPMIRESSAAPKTKAGKWPYYVCGKKRRQGWRSCEGKQVKAERADRAVIDAVLSQVLTVERVGELIRSVQAAYGDKSEIQKQEDAARTALAACEKSISALLNAIESVNSPTARERLKEREAERARLLFELSAMEARRKAAEVVITPDALALALDVWRGQVEAMRDQNDVKGLQRFLRKVLVKVELGYDVARLWYTFNANAFVSDFRFLPDMCRDR